jgi:hypothetical protein
MVDLYTHMLFVGYIYRALQSKRIVIFIICNIGTSHLLGQAINPFSVH